MKLEIKVIPNAKKETLKYENRVYTLKVSAQAIDNKANEAVIDFFKRALKIKRNSIKIIRGDKSRLKLLSIEAHDDLIKKYLSTL